MIRTGMKGIAYTLCMLYEALKDNNIKIKELKAGVGGTNSPLWMDIFSSL